MHARFLVVVVLVFLTITLGSTTALVALGRDLDGSVRLPLLVAILVVATSVMVRAVLLASVPQSDPELARRWRRWRSRGTLAGLAVGSLTTAVGVFLATPPVLAGLLVAVGVLVLVALVRALDRYADHTAAHHPVDVVRDGDEDRLAPAAVRATLRRRTAIGVVVGAVLGVVAAIVADATGSGAAQTVVVGGGVAITVVALVVGLGSFGLAFAAARRLGAVTFGDRARAKRIQTAILRRRTDALDDEDRRMAPEWARAAEPVFLLQLVGQLPVIVFVPGGQSLLLLTDPEDTFRRWLVVVMVVVLVPAYALVAHQWRRVRAFALESAPADTVPARE